MLLPKVGSTQDEARRLARDSGRPTVVVAARQVMGRGRTGRTWREAPRAMYSSLAFEAMWPAEARPRLTLVAGLAVRSALDDLLGVQPGLKWPNDLVTPHGKLGGILTEAQDDLVVIGCGVNLWWPDPPEGIAAACDDDPGPDVAAAIGEAWASGVLDVAAGDPQRWGAQAYREACVTLRSVVSWEPDGSGMAVDIDADGSLVVDTRAGRRRLTSGEVHTLRTATVAADPAVDVPGGDDVAPIEEKEGSG